MFLWHKKSPGVGFGFGIVCPVSSGFIMVSRNRYYVSQHWLKTASLAREGAHRVQRVLARAEPACQHKAWRPMLKAFGYLSISGFRGQQAACGITMADIKTSAASAAAMKARLAFSAVRYPRQACLQTWVASRHCCLPALGQ